MGVSFLFGIQTLLGSIFLFFVIPSVYLSFLLRRSVVKSLIFSVIAMLPVGIVIDYVIHLTHQWFVPSIFPFRIFGLVPIEDLIWGFFSIYFVLMFYEYFMESHHERKIWHPRMKVFSLLFISILLLFLVLYLFAPRLLYIPYAYFWLCFILVLIPVVIEMIRRPILFPKVLTVGVYFFFFDIFYEITALKLGWWTFPGVHYIGLVSLFGVQFPFEEFFFWMLLFSTAILSYYEPFDDDEK